MGALTLGALAAWGSGGCTHGAGSPDEAYARLVHAVHARDPIALFESLDLQTRWSWMSVQRSQREAYDVVLSGFPEPARQVAAARFEDGALVENAAELFARQAAPSEWAHLAAVVGDHAQVNITANRASVSVNGEVLPFENIKGWGYAGLQDAAKELEKRAFADLDSVRINATDYERAAVRASP